MLTQVVSGGQTGADQAGLRAAKACGLKVGGYAPKGFRTEKGGAPFLGTQFGLVEHPSPEYPPRTEMNVVISDGTVIFGKMSPGTVTTIQFCREHGKPYLRIEDVRNHYSGPKLRLWMARNNIRTLNVAGNRESKSPGIGLQVEKFLIKTFPKCK